MNMEINTDTLKNTAEKLLSLMSVSAKIEVTYDKKDEVFVVDIDAGETTGLLIGKRGETLLSIQLFFQALGV